ncbi:MAG TPA: nuclear transport factor 2 family protein [Thermoanaerobaculia bacterium]|nr:nuclear transport factor 2 family protein [Thermoanaerobaculia bacterium]
MNLPHRLAVTSCALGLLCLLFTACGTLAPEASGDEAAVLQAVRDACKTYLDGDADRLAEVLTEDFTLTDSSGVVTTRADDIEHARKGTIRYEVFENHDMKVRLHGDAAVITGRTTVKGQAGGTPFAAEFQFTDTLVRRDGRWRFVASHVSRISA